MIWFTGWKTDRLAGRDNVTVQGGKEKAVAAGKKRQANFELLRMTAMLMVVAMHFLSHTTHIQFYFIKKLLILQFL